MSIKWSKAEVTKLKRLYAKGLTYAEISKKFDGERSPESIRSKKRRLKLKPRFTNTKPHKELKTITNLDGNECRWPIKRHADGSWIFCANRKSPKSENYCYKHFMKSIPPSLQKLYGANGSEKQNE